MKILQISSAFPKSGKGSLYADIAEALADAGHSVIVAALDSDASDAETELRKLEKISMLRVRTGRIFNTGKIRKGISFLSIPFLLKKSLRKKLSGNSFDLVLFEAPPVTLWPAVAWAMKRFKCPSFLMQKDIFPQNAVDLRMFGKNSLPFFYFRRQERRMLQTATYIGCMSNGNIEYIRNHNRYLDPAKVVLFPNSKKPELKPARNRAKLERELGIPQDACVFLFAGNMGRPQNMGLICSAMKNFDGDRRAFFVAIGGGTESGTVKSFIAENCPKNSRFIDALPREEYETLAANCDVGIISLDPRFTIPNYPSKALSYMESAIPIAAATDTATDFKNLIENEAECGLWSDASKPDEFFRNLATLAENPELRTRLGENGRKYFLENFDIAKSVEILEKLFCGDGHA